MDIELILFYLLFFVYLVCYGIFGCWIEMIFFCLSVFFVFYGICGYWIELILIYFIFPIIYLDDILKLFCFIFLRLFLSPISYLYVRLRLFYFVFFYFSSIYVWWFYFISFHLPLSPMTCLDIGLRSLYCFSPCLP